MNSGEYAFKRTDIAHELPCNDLIARGYNNIFSIPTDTHMALLDDGRRVITGHMVGTYHWNDFKISTFWGGIDFRPTGYNSVEDYLYKNGLEGKLDVLNNEPVYIVTVRKDANGEKIEDKPGHFVTTESKRQMPLSMLSVNGDENDVLDCLRGTLDEAVKEMNESETVKGTEWIVSENNIVGVVNDKVCVIPFNNINEDRQVEYRCQLLPVLGVDGIPTGITILVDKKDQRNFEKWLETEEANLFAHAEGGNIEF